MNENKKVNMHIEEGVNKFNSTDRLVFLSDTEPDIWSNSVVYKIYGNDDLYTLPEAIINQMLSYLEEIKHYKNCTWKLI